SRYPFPLPSPHDPRPLPSFPTRRSSDLAPHVRRSPLAGVPAKSVIIQFAKGDQIVPNPTQTALVRAGELADRTTFFRTDLFYAALPRPLPAAVSPPLYPHTFLNTFTPAGAPAGSLQAQARIPPLFAG